MYLQSSEFQIWQGKSEIIILASKQHALFHVPVKNSSASELTLLVAKA
jgi:hypothetical protein